MSRTNDVKERSIGGLKLQQVENFIDSEFKHKLDEVIIHCGTNNVENDDKEEILRNFKTLSDSFSRDTKLTFSGIIHGADKPYLNEKLTRLTHQFKNSASSKDINNNNKQFRHLNRGGLHINVAGQKQLAMNFISLIRASGHPGIRVALNLKCFDTKITLLPKVAQTWYIKA